LILCGSVFSQNGDLRVTEPEPSKDGTIVIQEPAIYLRGTLSWRGGDQRVLWESNRGFSDMATVRLMDDGRTVMWNSTTPVPLRPGINHVRIKALGQPGAATSVNIFYTAQAPAQSPAHARTVFHGTEITYEVRDGLAVYQSDMVLGKAAGARSAKGFRPESLTTAPNLLSSTGLWPVVDGVVRVPYTITNVTSANTNNINAAITESNTQLAGVVQWQPATSSDTNLVNFDFDPTNLNGSCESFVGMVGGTQTIGGSINCTTTTILHEMGHALGLYHEQSRADRDGIRCFPVLPGWRFARPRDNPGRNGSQHQPAAIHLGRPGWNHAPLRACAQLDHGGHESQRIAAGSGQRSLYGSLRLR
jgi:hypothetical protein